MRSISSPAYLLPTSVRASQRRLCRGSGTGRHTLQVRIPPNSLGVGAAGLQRGAREVLHSQKNIYHCRRRYDQTNQQRLENMISPEEECECWGTLLSWCTLGIDVQEKKAWWDQGGRFQGPTAGKGWYKRSFKCSRGLRFKFLVIPFDCG